MGASYLTELEREEERESEGERESGSVCERMHYVQEEPLEFQRKTTMTMSNISLLIASAPLKCTGCFRFCFGFFFFLLLRLFGTTLEIVLFWQLSAEAV